MIYQETQQFNRLDIFLTPLAYISHFLLEFARKKKPSGLKKEKQKGKLPNQIRHDLNAAIAVGTWTNKGVRSQNKKK
jgi:hypothetical protein